MNADDFRDYMLSFLFLRYLSDNYETAAKKELGKDYPKLNDDDKRTPLCRFGMPQMRRMWRILKNKCAVKCIM